ncbi:hypothetical protein GIB67_027466, partial [Kingdonia uniflora]
NWNYDSRSNDRTPPLELWPKGSSRSNDSQPRLNDFGKKLQFLLDPPRSSHHMRPVTWMRLI